MKIKNYRSYTWEFQASSDSKMKCKYKSFKYKRDLMKFLYSNLPYSLNGSVVQYESYFGGCGPIGQWDVWYNDYKYNYGANLKIELKRVSRNFLKHNISKKNKKYFAFSEKVISLMCNLRDENGNITAKKAKKLVEVFKKRGFKDFTPDTETQEYIDFYLKEGIDFTYWSDRCNWVRTKTIISYFEKEGLLN